MGTGREAALDLLASGKPLSYSAIREAAGSRKVVEALVAAGEAERVGHNMYVAVAAADASWRNLAFLAERAPKAVICLDTAAAFHGLTTQNPHEVHAAFPYASTPPANPGFRLKAHRWRGAAMEVGIETVEVGGTEVRITGRARTVIDLLRRTARTGDPESALEALAGFLDGGRAADLTAVAKKFGVAETLAPILSAANAMRGPR